MKAIKIFALILLFTLISGCTEKNPIVGVYISSENHNESIELRDDGRIILSQEHTYSGDYIVKEDSVILIFPLGSYELKRDGPNLIDEFGNVWVKT